MTLTMEQFRERLVDYLYGELEGEEREAFEACLAASETCQQELESMRHTLSHARSGLAELQEPPPPGLHHRLLALADREGRRSHARLRLPWIVLWLRNPAFISAAGLATVALLAVVGRQAFRARPEDLANPPAQTTHPTADSAATPTREVAKPGASDGERTAPEATEPTDRQPHQRRGLGEASPAQLDQATEGAPAPPSAKKAQPAPPRRTYAEPPPSWRPQRAAERTRRRERRATPAARGEKKTKGAAPAPVGARPSDLADDTRATPMDLQQESEPEPEAKAAPALRSAATDGSGSGAGAAGSGHYAPAELIRRAEKHLAEGRPQDAARAYLSLLQRFPQDPRRADWRARLTAAKRASSAP